MNTVKSFWIGWGSLCVAGGAAYYFAKQSINADRQARYDAELRRQRVTEALGNSNAVSVKPLQGSSGRSFTIADQKMGNLNGRPPGGNISESSSQKAGSKLPPTGRAPESSGQRVREMSKYEASEPYRAKKGDRFS